MGEVNAVEQHGELGPVQLRAQSVFVDYRLPEAALLQALVVEDEAAVVPGEELRAVALSGEEDEEVAGEEVLLPLVLHQRAEPVDAVAHVDGLGGEEDADRSREEQHRLSPRPRAAVPGTSCPCQPRTGQ